jgi:hypothetical protein
MEFVSLKFFEKDTRFTPFIHGRMYRLKEAGVTWDYLIEAKSFKSDYIKSEGSQSLQRISASDKSDEG